MWRPRPKALAMQSIAVLAASILCISSLCASEKPEYSNLPISSPELRQAVRRADLIARAHITAYQPPSVHDGIAKAEQVTLSIDEVYSGKFAQHSTLTYECLCHMVEPPAAASLVGHEIIALLRYDAKQGSWSSALQPSPTYYNALLRDRVLRLVKGRR